MDFRLKVLVPVAVGVAALLPTSAFAQAADQPVVQPPHQTAFCGDTDMPVMRTGDLMVDQREEVTKEEGMLTLSAVRGSVVHMEGNLMLLRLETPGMGNAAPNHELAGDSWAVVRMPDRCSQSDFRMGAPVLAIGSSDETGILAAVEITETA
jgi:hypothetical protein